jgi:tryptophanase
MTTNIDNMFEVAIKSKFRFPFKGSISTEDLWDLTVDDLDIIFKSLNSQMKQVKEESLLDTRTKQDEEIMSKIEIVKHIVATKLEERAFRLKAKEQKEKKQKIMEIMSNKQDADLQNKSIEELSKMLDELN